MAVYDNIKDDDIYSDNMPDVIKDYLRDECITDSEINRYWKRAVKYIEDYTGHSRDELEGNSVLIQPLLAIIADMHDNRQYQGDRTYINELVESMLGLYRHNLL